MSSRTCFEICTLETITTNENISGRTTQQRTECTFLLSAHRSMQLLFMKDQGRLFTALSVSQRAPSGSQNRNAETSMTRLDVFRKPAGMLKQVHDVTYSQSQHCHHFCSCSLLRGRRTVNDQPVSLALTNPRPATTYHGSVPKQKGESKRLSSCITSGRYLLSHAVAHILPSARDGLTAGFGMEPGVSRPGIFTQNICSLKST